MGGSAGSRTGYHTTTAVSIGHPGGDCTRMYAIPRPKALSTLTRGRGGFKQPCEPKKRPRLPDQWSRTHLGFTTETL
jgi:hypothetical protein